MTTNRCEIHVLGRVAVTFADGRTPVTRFRTRKAALLLAYLALHPGKARPRELLLDLFWPEASLEAGRSNLSTTLSTLRRQIGNVFTADHATVQLDAEVVRVDAARFETLARRGLNARLSVAERADALRGALALWEAPLPGVYDDWAVEAQTLLEALADQARDALERLEEAPGASGSPPVPAPPAADPLPSPLSRFVGRPDERAALDALLDTARLVTLLGPGGVGKTRLAVEVARAAAPRFARTVFVSLADLPVPALVPPTLRRALSATTPGGDPLAEAVAHLNAAPGRTLVLLDNAEHLLPAEGDGDGDEEKARFGFARMVRHLLESCPNLTVLATSRQPVGVEAEQQVPVPLLSAASAVDLFVDRARAVRPDFACHDGNRAQIEAICALLDGLPLAIELAATWVRVLSLTELRERLERERLWLEGRRRDLNPRQKSLEATLRWSWQLLDAAERDLLAALSVFRGGWSLDAAEAVAGGEATLETLFHLVDKSLAVVEPAPEGTRYRLLESVRQFAAERLEESGAASSARGRHLAFFHALTAAAAPCLVGAEQRRWLSALDRECDNLRAALETAVGDPGRSEAGLAMAGALWRFWWMRGCLDEGRGWCRRLLALGDGAPTAVRAAALHGAGALANLQGDYADADRHNAASLAIRRALGDDQGAAASLSNLGNTAFDRGDHASSRRFHEESLALKRVLGDRKAIGVSLNNLGNIAYYEGDHASSRRFHEESLAIKEEIGDAAGIAAALLNLGNVAMALSDHETARARFRRSLEVRREIGDRAGAIIALESLASLASRVGDRGRAVRLYAATARLHRQIGAVRPQMAETGYRAGLEQLRAALGEADFAAGWAAGERLTEDEAVALALAPHPAPLPNLA